MTRILIISGVALLIVAIVASFFFFVLGGSSGPNGNGGRSDFFSALFPFSGEGGGEQNQQEEEAALQPSGPAARIRHVTPRPVSGFGLIERDGKTYIQYMERETGNVFETPADSLETSRISNTTIPRVTEALWAGDGRIIMRYLDDNERIVTFSGTVATSSSPDGGSLAGNFLPSGITALSISPNKKNIFYLLNTSRGARGTIANLDGGASEVIFESPLSEWTPLWAGQGEILVTKKPASDAMGASYVIDTETGNTALLTQPRPGLTVSVATTTAYFFFSTAEDGQLASFLSLRGSVTPVAIATLPEKCAWDVRLHIFCGSSYLEPNKTYPDDWYLGRTTFTDNIWELADPRGGEAKLIEFSSETIPGGVDVLRPQILNEYFVFINKKDLSLWSVKVSPEKPSVEEGQP